MSYEVLARKWRPARFDQLVGQAPVVRALTNGLNSDRLHHAFLFTGTRGVGKTTVARILARALNCERGVSSTPCGECTSCTEIAEGRFVDLIEVDAASRTKVDETRELLENVPYAPVRGRFKVYLIDEVHMFSNHSFNALLKTLEEPPPHVKFLLATTDPQRLPVTILSRCLRFSLRRLTPRELHEHLATIIQAEDIEAETSALERLAQAADGSVRDALSLLDQAIAFGAGRVRLADVESMLGVVPGERVRRLIERLAAADAPGVLALSAELAQSGTVDFTELLGDLAMWLQRMALVQAVPGALGSDVPERDALVALAAAVDPQELQLWYQIAILGRRDLPLAPDPHSGFDMLMIRMLSFRPGGVAPRAEAEPSHTPARPTRPDPASIRSERTQSAPPAAVQSGPAIDDIDPPDWAELLEQLGLGGLALEVARHCVWGGREGRRITLVIDPERVRMATPTVRGGLEQALRQRFGSEVVLQLQPAEAPLATPARRQAEQTAERQSRAEQAVAADPTVQALQQTLGARIVSGSVEVVDD
ncbi:MAG: DNA polymerase III subunit gamma/tau [Chromatiales bacterium]|nr:DNA polymerase III subunit gamma/tau [Chromatiales bacterium]